MMLSEVKLPENQDDIFIWNGPKIGVRIPNHKKETEKFTEASDAPKLVKKMI
jgi:hypothetical protein